MVSQVNSIKYISKKLYQSYKFSNEEKKKTSQFTLGGKHNSNIKT